MKFGLIIKDIGYCTGFIKQPVKNRHYGEYLENNQFVYVKNMWMKKYDFIKYDITVRASEIIAIWEL